MAFPELSTKIKALAGKPNYSELYTLGLLSLGVPYVVYLWTNWKGGLTALVLIQVALGLISLRKPE